MNDELRIRRVKQYLFQTAHKARVGHIPSSLSSVEIMYVLYNKIANITKNNANNLDRDRVIISKEHARLGQVAVLAEAGLIDSKLLDKFMCDEDSILGHDLYGAVSKRNIDAIDVACGSLGHGLPLGVGLAWDSKYNVYVIVGDGELQEGTNWESIIFIGAKKLNNITLIIDRNNQQIDNYVTNIVDTYTNIARQIEAFGFDVLECDGHNIDELERVFNAKTAKPKCVIANTIKGKDCRFALNEMGFGRFHAAPLSFENYQKVCQGTEIL